MLFVYFTVESINGVPGNRSLQNIYLLLEINLVCGVDQVKNIY